MRRNYREAHLNGEKKYRYYLTVRVVDGTSHDVDLGNFHVQVPSGG